jgi:POT family proton-dependent oligopeptide transporter
MSNTVTSTGHPKALYVLFMAEMWERFCYYGMRALLTLYLINTLLNGDTVAFAIYGAYTALVYAAPVLGGRMADQLLGYRYAVILGGVLMALGEFFILGNHLVPGISADSWLFIGMGTIIVGNGYFKANISSIVGRLYEDTDPRKDSGFTIFYIGINIGALLATTVCAEVGNIYGYEWGFALAGFGMILGMLFFLYMGKIIGGEEQIRENAAPPDPQKLNESWIGPLSRFHVTIIGSLLIIPILYYLLVYNAVVGWLLAAIAVYVIGNLLSVAFKSDNIQRDKILVLIILMFFNITFWACFEQAGTSLTLFAERNVDRTIFGWEMGAATTQFFNPFFIMVFGSIFSWLWVALAKKGLNPNIPMKFGLGILQLGIGYLMVIVGGWFSVAYIVPLWTLTFLYLFHTTGELCLSPIGLSMVTKLAPKSMTGTVMGAWFLSFAGSNYLAGILAQLTGGEGHGGGEAVTITAAESLATYTDVFSSIGFITVGIGIFLMLISPFLNKMMHGVK